MRQFELNVSHRGREGRDWRGNVRSVRIVGREARDRGDRIGKETASPRE